MMPIRSVLNCCQRDPKPTRILVHIIYWTISLTTLRSYQTTTAWINNGFVFRITHQNKNSNIVPSRIQNQQQQLQPTNNCQRAYNSLKFYKSCHSNSQRNGNSERNTDSVDVEKTVWEVGNVEDDFDNLERAIRYTNADQNLYHEERLEALDYFAQQRVPLRLAIRNVVLTPLVVSFVVSGLIYRMIHHTSIPPTLSSIAILCQRMIRLVSMIQFWSLIVVAPTIFLCYRIYGTKVTTATASHTPVESQSDHYLNLRYLTSRSASIDNRSASTHDYVRCLLEQLVSCTFGVTLLGLTWFSLSFRKPVIAMVPVCGVYLVQFCTRIAVMASLRQYKSLWFALFRKQQPHPLSCAIWMTQSLVASANNMWFVTLDLISIALFSPSLRIFSAATTFFAAMLWYITILSERMINDNKPDDSDKEHHRLIAEKLSAQLQQISRFSVSALIAFLVWSRLPALSECYHRVVSRILVERTVFATQISWLKIGNVAGLSVALVGPVCHLLAFLRLVDVSLSQNVSLTMNSDQFAEATKPGNKLFWRYKLRWREPQRVYVTLRIWWKEFWYWFFVRGSVDEKLRQEKRRQIQGNVARARGLNVLQKVAIEQPSLDSSRGDRTQWKTHAMTRLAQKHQDDYDRDSYSDPLGVAVYRTLGIGLGFNFDHMNTLASANVPSIRRLQSRAAKSAIRRVNEIYNTDRARVQLDQIIDPVELQKLASSLWQEAENEVLKLADRLTELVPPDLSWDEEQNIKEFRSGNPIRQSKINIPSIQAESPALKKLFEKYFGPPITKEEFFDVDYLNPMGTDETTSDDEFVIEWYNKKREARVDDTKNADDGETTIDTVLA